MVARGDTTERLTRDNETGDDWVDLWQHLRKMVGLPLLAYAPPRPSFPTDLSLFSTGLECGNGAGVSVTRKPG